MNGNPVLAAQRAIVQEFDWGQLHWFANSKIGNSQTTTFGKCIIKAGQANFRHSHPNCEEILQVVSGEIIHSLGDEQYRMGPGDTIVIPPNIVHNAENVGAGDAVMTIIFSTPDRQTQMVEEDVRGY
ncbi:MAG: cupin domain-containing protein [Chloroflexi bacterium]|nr:MAG: cupin domain-containing protein [Chloroflexota bacterium]